MKLIYILPIFAILFLSCDKDDICTRGNGPVIKKEIFLSAITAINASTSGDVIIKQGPVQKVEIEAQSNIIDEVSRNVVNGKWNIGFDHCVSLRKGMTVYITVPQLNEIKSTGSGDLQSASFFNFQDLDLDVTGSGDVSLDMHVDDLTVTQTGSGDVVLSGEADTQLIQVTGSGDYKAFNLISKNTEVTLTGSGDGRVYASTSLRVSISGSGDLEYKGSPTIYSYKSTGSGKLVNKN